MFRETKHTEWLCKPENSILKREKATSNICTAQVLLAIAAGMYAVYHGPEGVKAIADKIYFLTNLLNSGLNELGFKQLNRYFLIRLK